MVAVTEGGEPIAVVVNAAEYGDLGRIAQSHHLVFDGTDRCPCVDRSPRVSPTGPNVATIMTSCTSGV